MSDVILSNSENEGSKQEEGKISCHHITIIVEDVEDAPKILKDGGQSIIDELKVVNLGTIEEHLLTLISASL